MTTATVSNELIEAIAARLDLREPNKAALETLAVELGNFESAEGMPPFEGVIDAATGVGKTYILAAAIDYYAALGTRNFAVVTPGRTILEKTVNNFTLGHPKSLLNEMETKPVVITSENFSTPAMRTAMDDPTQVKLYVFTVQALTKPKTTKVGRKTHKFQEGLGKAFYEHLDNCDDLIVFADEHHCYYGKAFSSAIRDLTPRALVGLTATPHKRTPEEEIIYRYPLAAAIADELVKTPVLTGRKDDVKDARTRLLDGVALQEAKAKAIQRYCDQTGAESVNPVMLVIAQKIDDAEEYAGIIRDEGFAGGRYSDRVLVVHSDAPDEALKALEQVEDPESPVRIIISVGMLKEGWDVKNVYVICSMRSSISDILTEQTLGRGLRLPWGRYTDWELLDTLEVLAHERYEQLLKKAKTINESFIDHRTRAVVRKNAEGKEVTTIEQEGVSVEVVPVDKGADPTEAGEGGGAAPVISSYEERKEQAEAEAVKSGAELKPVKGAPSIALPILRPTEVKSEFSLNDITELDPFEKLGKSIAKDPAKEFRRLRLSARIVTGPDGLKHTELAPVKTIDKIEAQQVLIPLEGAKKELVDQVMTSPVVPSRSSERKAAGRLVESFVKGLGEQAELVLGGYLDRAAGGLIELITEEHRRFAPKPGFKEEVDLEDFAPTRTGKVETSTDRIGTFKKSVGYTGWSKRTMYEEVWFDSSTERSLANLLDDADEIKIWVRLITGDLEIHWEGGNYNPDFIATDKDGIHWVIEVKADRDVADEAVQGKRQAAKRWANHVTSNSNVEDEWRYMLASESDIDAAKGSWPALVARAT